MGGLPRNILPATPRDIAKYAAMYGWETAALRGASPYRQNPNGNAYGNPPQVGLPSNYQGFPNLPADLVTWLGTPAGVFVANAIGGYLCANVGNQLDAFGLGPALVQAGGALDSREAVGLAQAGSFTSKVAIELLGGAERYADAGTAFGDIAVNGAGAVLTVFRVNPNASAADRWIFSKYNGANGYGLVVSTGHLIAYAFGTTTQGATLALNCCDGGWHYALTVVDDVAKTISLFSDLGNVTSAAYTGSVTNNGHFTLGYTANSFSGQIAACYALDVAVPASAGTAYWRHGLMAAPFLHARTGPMIAPISAHRVGLWTGGNVGQPCIGYDASLVSAPLGNPGGSGYVAEAGASFMAISSNDLITTGASNWSNVNATGTGIDGPSGLRDAVRVAMLANWAIPGNYRYTSIPSTPVGASNVPFVIGGFYKRGSAGTTARVGLYFLGDAGGGEPFTVLADPATPLDWTPWWATVTPTRPGHNSVYVVIGAALNGEDCDHAELWLIENRNYPTLAWRRVGSGAPGAQPTTTPTYSAVNNSPANYIYNPLRGSIPLTVGAFQGTAGATFLQFGAAAAAGSITADNNAGQLRVRMWDAAAALVAAVNCGAVSSARHDYTIDYDSMVSAISVSENGVVLGSWTGPAWTSAPGAVTPLYWGSASGVNPARCLLV